MILPLLLLAAAPQTNAAGIKPAPETTPVAPLPPANPVPYTDPDAANVMAPVNALFAGIAARDAAAIATAELPEGGGATIVIEQPGGARTVSHLAWAAVNAHFQPGPEKYEERLEDPAIETDGDVAMVWGNYRFFIDGKLHHCGVDHFDLVRKDGQWKIANVTWSQRTTGCGA